MTEVAHLTIRLRLFSDRVHNCEHPTEVIERLQCFRRLARASALRQLVRMENERQCVLSEARPAKPFPRVALARAKIRTERDGRKSRARRHAFHLVGMHA